ncbi:hypothetical protein CEXT_408781 [Caerostris extrusa]|uniref:Uncharacterized protein n=1 Tax=Caerostris extrusa TaxID=172846 RepID=A0AAV4WMD2_CAEEX|nr:hypothetical protein CEXT_408781 [Caerostris extrusa]
MNSLLFQQQHRLSHPNCGKGLEPGFIASSNSLSVSKLTAESGVLARFFFKSLSPFPFFIFVGKEVDYLEEGGKSSIPDISGTRFLGVECNKTFFFWEL